MKVYLIPGIGADYRLFENFELPDQEIIHLDWDTSIDCSSLGAYAQGISSKIKADEPFAVLGVSMGGMVATELGNMLNPDHVILVSSSKSWDEFPPKIKWAKGTGVYRLFGGKSLQWMSTRMKKVLGPKGKASLEICRTMTLESDPDFMKKGTRAILNWRNTKWSDKTTHIHGDEDWTLPLKYVNADHIIKGGTHFMIHDRGKEISTLVQEILKHGRFNHTR